MNSDSVTTVTQVWAHVNVADLAVNVVRHCKHPDLYGESKVPVKYTDNIFHIINSQNRRWSRSCSIVQWEPVSQPREQ